MQSVDENESQNKKLRILRSSNNDMPLTDNTIPQNVEDSILFPIEEIVQSPLPGYEAPTSIGFSAEDSLLTYLFSPDHTLSRKVFAFDLKSGKQELFFGPPDGGLDESNISPEEKLRRERLRQRGLGVTWYEWVKTGSKKKAIMVPLPSGLYLQELHSSKPELKLPSSALSPVIDPHVSPDGTMLAYIRESELHVLNLLYNESKQLTHGAQGNTVTHGLAEYIAQEEMDRKNGYWWSLDSKFIAFTQVDSSEIPLFRIMHQGESSVGSEAQEDHPYPFAGASNVKVRLGVVSVHGDSITWMDLLCGGTKEPDNEDEYLARVHWMHGNVLIAQVLNRSHSKLKLLKFDIKTGKKEVLYAEEQLPWINLHDCFAPLDKGITKYSGGFIWASEKSGFRHLCVHDANGTCLGPITEGEWMVEQIAGINEAAGMIYFTATLDGPLESHLYRAKLYPIENNPLQAPVRLTNGKGKHSVVLDHRLQNFVDIHDSLDSPPRVSLCSLFDGREIMPLFEQSFTIPRFKRLELEPPKIVQIQANDGTILYGALYDPDPTRFGPPPYKTMISVYGGPGVQYVCDSWIGTADMRAQYLRSQGILVWKLDNRGSARRGLKFEGALKGNPGRFDAEDQLTGAEWLIKQGLAKAGHIGLCGWSYGGYMSAVILARFPDVFCCAVSGAPVTSWDGYDTFYTEKYMGLPSDNPKGYEYGSVMHHVHKLKGRLLLVHGMIDENVHFRHTARLVNALVAAGKPYELLIFPDERHMPRRQNDRIYMEERIWEFFQRSL
ncbi:dipeptidyl aminopeptidase 4-like isoform X1 [Populus alba x Populus x berolinensis]|uniref:Dipeptidyl aminopeptidase 4-like isoform X1 n=3 Tax=Populus alba x Populus x berolinensis TaxID=444605 RepID=A0AAD6M0W5_9ROSI|nr:dipeptidyl aminopeptidase 4-like isoform X1 [Populus alba x Populus x berolinensis]